MPLVPGSPYEPVPATPGPTERPLRVFGVPEVPDAFGTGVARAVSTFGGDVEQAGGEVFDRALALRRLQIEGNARDNVTETMNNVENIKNKFRAKEGYAAGQDAMNDALAEADQERLRGRAKAIQFGGTYGGQFFDNEYASMQRSIVRDIGSWSQSQLGKAQKTSIANANAAGSNVVGASPWSEDVWTTQRDARKAREETDGSLSNLPRDEIELNKKEAVSSLALTRIAGAAVADVGGTGAALDMFQRLKASGELSNLKDIRDAEKLAREGFDSGSKAAIESAEQDLLNDVIAHGSPNRPLPQRKLAEINSLRERRVATGEAQAVSDLAAKNLQERIGAAQTTYNVNTALDGSSQFQSTIDAAAAKHGLNSILFARQLYQESRLDPNVKDSSAGAQGIAQFMPETARKYGVDVRNPESSIDGAARYMDDLMHKPYINGNVGLALAGYDWGEANVQAWLAGGRGPPKETLDYVQKITGQSLGDWITGKQPNISALSVPEGAAGSVQRALGIVNNDAANPAYSASEQQLRRRAGEAAIKDWQERNIRLAATSEAKQSKVNNDARDVVLGSIYNETQTPITPQDILSNPRFAQATNKKELIDLVNKAEMPDGIPAQTSAANAIQMYKRMQLPEGDPNKITDPRVIDSALGVTLNRRDHEWLQNSFFSPRAPGGEKLKPVRARLSGIVQKVLDTSTIEKVDQDGMMNYYRWEHDLDDAINRYQSEGKDIFQLFNPDNEKEFFGSDKKLQGYMTPMQRQQREMITQMQAQTAKATGGNYRKPGESMDDYDKRAGIR